MSIDFLLTLDPCCRDDLAPSAVDFETTPVTYKTAAQAFNLERSYNARLGLGPGLEN